MGPGRSVVCYHPGRCICRRPVWCQNQRTFKRLEQTRSDVRINGRAISGDQRRFAALGQWPSRTCALVVKIVGETLNQLERLASYGVAYRSFTEQYLDSCGLFKDAVLAILAAIAKQERVRLSERTIGGLEKAGRVGGRPKVVCDRHKVERLREAGLSLAAIALKVNVSKSSIHRMLNT